MLEQSAKMCTYMYNENLWFCRCHSQAFCSNQHASHTLSPSETNQPLRLQGNHLSQISLCRLLGSTLLGLYKTSLGIHFIRKEEDGDLQIYKKNKFTCNMDMTLSTHKFCTNWYIHTNVHKKHTQHKEICQRWFPLICDDCLCHSLTRC